MTCPHLIDGRCRLAEEAAAKHLLVVIECRPGSDTCSRCVAESDPPARSNLAMLQLVAPQLPAEKGPEWLRSFAKIRRRKKRAAELKRVGPCAHRGEEIEKFKCSCSGGDMQPLYQCGVFGQCVGLKRQSERASEHLRKKHHGDRELRKFGVCQGCDRFTAADS